MFNGYKLIDSGNGQKLEKFGRYTILRPCGQAVWDQQINGKWQNIDAIFSREEKNLWGKKDLPNSWEIDVDGIKFKLAPTDFGHLGIFPEQRGLWRIIKEKIKSAKRPLKVLNLFAYSGGSTLASALAGASVTHLDASKGMVTWARENAEINNLKNHPIRWIVDDVRKFLKREIKRNNSYDAIILDPPSFGRGAKGEFFKIEYELNNLLRDCNSLLSDNPVFILLSCHTPGYTEIVLKNILKQNLTAGRLSTGEMILDGAEEVYDVPSGMYAIWEPK